MMEVLNQIVKRLGEDPNKIADLVNKRSLLSDQLHNALDTLREQEIIIAGSVADRRKQDGTLVFPNQDLRAAETLRLLAVNSEYQKAKTLINVSRQQLRELDAELELAGRRNNADQKVVALVTALISSGMQQEAYGILDAYLPEQVVYPAGASPNTETNVLPAHINSSHVSEITTEGQNGGVFLVLEARPGRSEGTIRAYCEGPDGKKVAVYGKNGNGQMLLHCLGKKAKIQCTPGDKGLIAYKVEPVA